MLVFSLTFAFTACGDSAAKTDSATEAQGKEFTSAYVCPMHCADSGSDKPGECPVCGMTYTANAEHTKDNHQH